MSFRYFHHPPLHWLDISGNREELDCDFSFTKLNTKAQYPKQNLDFRKLHTFFHPYLYTFIQI